LSVSLCVFSAASTAVFDLTVALQVGLLLACVLFVRRTSSLFQVVEMSNSGEEAQAWLHGSLFFLAPWPRSTLILNVAESACRHDDPSI
jgi:SulP family sulfate permease